MKVLIVDDNYWTAETIREIFELKGIDSECSYTSKDAISKIQNNDYDCVLLDIIINGDKEDGIDLFKLLKDKNPDAEVLFITGCNEDSEYAKTANSLSKVVYKDFSPSDLADDLLAKEKECQIV